MGRSSSSPAPGRARRGSSSSASGGCSRRSEDLLPEQILVLTYNVKAARELRDAARRRPSGPRSRARMSVSNFHSFCQRILTESAADAGLPARPDVLDGVGQVLLLRTSAPSLRARSTTHRTGRSPSFVAVHQPGEGRAGRAGRLRSRSSPRSGASSRRDTAASTTPRSGSAAQGNLDAAARGPRRVRGRARERARRGPRRDARLRRGRRRQGRRPRGAPHGRRRRARAQRASQFAAERPPADRRAGRRPTSSTARRSRSCA